MAVPIILAETLAITKLYLLFTRNFQGWVHNLNRVVGIIVGLYFIGVIIYLLMTAVFPITKAGEWRNMIDVIAVGCYLLSGLPLIFNALQELGFVNASATQNDKLKVHAICVAVFLIFGHIAMITGMLDPALLGFEADPSSAMPMHHDH